LADIVGAALGGGAAVEAHDLLERRALLRLSADQKRNVVVLLLGETVVLDDLRDLLAVRLMELLLHFQLLVLRLRELLLELIAQLSDRDVSLGVGRELLGGDGLGLQLCPGERDREQNQR
jgi:hypothetical protein